MPLIRKTITHPPLAALADCMAALDELDADAGRAWVLAALRSDPRYAALGADVPLPATRADRITDAVFAGPLGEPLGTTPSDGHPAGVEP